VIRHHDIPIALNPDARAAAASAASWVAMANPAPWLSRHSAARVRIGRST
jgi:hypothetical protein